MHACARTQLQRLRTQEGLLRASETAAASRTGAMAATLAQERLAEQARQQHVVALVASLRQQVGARMPLAQDWEQLQGESPRIAATTLI